MAQIIKRKTEMSEFDDLRDIIKHRHCTYIMLVYDHDLNAVHYLSNSDESSLIKHLLGGAIQRFGKDHDVFMRWVGTA